jgi:hypothetical protein
MNKNTLKILIFCILQFSIFGTKADSLVVFGIEKVSPFVKIDEQYLTMFYTNNSQITIQELHQNPSKYFRKQANLNPNFKENWVRVAIENKQSRIHDFLLDISIRWHSEVYLFAEHAQEPIVMRAGTQFPESERTFALNGISKVPLQLAKGKFVLYVRFRDLPSLDKICDCTFSLWLMEGKSTMKNIVNYRVFEGIFLGIFLVMTLYNAVIYFFTKDKTYQWYVLSLFSFTSYFLFGNVHRNLDWFAETHIQLSHLLFISNLSILFASFCFIHFIRLYLKNAVLNRFWNKFLSMLSYYLLAVNFVLDVISWLSSLGYLGKNLDMSFYANINYAILLASLLVLSIKAVLSKSITGKYFAIANGLFFIFALVNLLSDRFLGLFVGNSFTEHCTSLGVSFQVATFSIALAQRIQNLQKEVLLGKITQERLEKEKLEAVQQTIQAKNEELEAKVKERTYQLEQSNEEIRSQASQIQAQADALHEINSRELMNKTLQILQKNESLGEIFKLMEKIKPNLKGEEEKILYKNIIRTIRESLDVDKQWEDFKEYFEKVYPTLFNEMYKICPTLTQSDLRLCAYMKMGLNRKEIAQMLNINPESVRKHIYRLKLKLGKELQEIEDLI